MRFCCALMNSVWGEPLCSFTGNVHAISLNLCCILWSVNRLACNDYLTIQNIVIPHCNDGLGRFNEIVLHEGNSFCTTSWYEELLNISELLKVRTKNCFIRFRCHFGQEYSAESPGTISFVLRLYS